MYMDVEDLDDYKVPDTEDKIKVTLSGSYEQFKALKKTKKYKSLLKEGIKVVFKPRKLTQEKEVKGVHQGTSFMSILNQLILNEKDPHLMQVYDLVINKKKTSVNDIIFL